MKSAGLINNLYRICGVPIILIGTLIFVWGFNKNMNLDTNNLVTITGEISSYEVNSSLISIKLKGNQREYIYLKKYGNFVFLENYLQEIGEGMVYLETNKNQHNLDIQHEIYSLTINGNEINSLNNSVEISRSWVRSIYFLSFLFLIIGLISVLFGDKIAKMDKKSD